MTGPAAERLSVIVIAKDEAAAIGRCLGSVAWAGERVVLDSGSTDDTAAIARACGARVEITPDWPGFGPQKNRVLALATGEWVLSLDADEWVTPELAAAIRAALADPGPHAAWRMPRLTSFCGRFMRHGGWSPDYVTRLWRRGRARFSDDLVHERVIVEGSVGTLGPPLMHEGVTDLADALAKMDSYSTAGARMLLARGRRASLGTAVAHGAWTFLRVYLLKAAILDGREGFLLAVANAEGAFYKYAKLNQMDRDRRRT